MKTATSCKRIGSIKRFSRGYTQAEMRNSKPIYKPEWIPGERKGDVIKIKGRNYRLVSMIDCNCWFAQNSKGEWFSITKRHQKKEYLLTRRSEVPARVQKKALSLKDSFKLVIFEGGPMGKALRAGTWQQIQTDLTKLVSKYTDLGYKIAERKTEYKNEIVHFEYVTLKQKKHEVDIYVIRRNR